MTGSIHEQVVALLRIAQPRSTATLAEALRLPPRLVGEACGQLQSRGQLRSIRGAAVQGGPKVWKLVAGQQEPA